MRLPDAYRARPAPFGAIVGHDVEFAKPPARAHIANVKEIVVKLMTRDGVGHGAVQD